MAGGMEKFLKQAQKMQEEMLRIQEGLKTKEVKGSAGGGMVEVVATADSRLRSVTIKPEVANANDIEMLQDLVLTAVNQALENAAALSSSEIARVTGGLGIAGLGM